MFASLLWRYQQAAVLGRWHKYESSTAYARPFGKFSPERNIDIYEISLSPEILLNACEFRYFFNKLISFSSFYIRNKTIPKSPEFLEINH